MPHRRLNKLQVANGKHRMLMHAITYARSAFLVSGPLDAHMRIIQQIKRQCDRANYMSYCTRWKWKLTRTSFNGQLSQTVLLVTLHSWNGITGTDPIPVSFALRDRKITLGRLMPDDVSDYAYFHGVRILLVRFFTSAVRTESS